MAAILAGYASPPRPCTAACGRARNSTINSAVDANNLVSLETGFSLGTYDLACLQGDLVLRLGREGEGYAGIGKDTLDLNRMPLLADALGPFGCPCSGRNAP